MRRVQRNGTAMPLRRRTPRTSRRACRRRGSVARDCRSRVETVPGDARRLRLVSHDGGLRHCLLGFRTDCARQVCRRVVRVSDQRS
ncbi:hypothetical protein BN1723_019589 [Verticillium longisporum]|uniref:Uncharacterized protein n=1 Tax=Verticillium longisporum TaxID=100787 RepID=A0A0G4NEE4_VERLO|nr:hypothetical protein BN1723_019589 [Verticillium longisporum]